MNFVNHIFYTLILGFFAKETRITEDLYCMSWYYLVTALLLSCALPDVDHKQSHVRRKLHIIFKGIKMQHRGFTHSVFIAIIIVIFINFDEFIRILDDGFL